MTTLFPSQRSRLSVAVLLSLSLLAFALPGCSKSSEEAKSGGEGSANSEQTKQPDSPPEPVAPEGPSGTVKGTVILEGAPPEMKPLKRGSDAFCARTEMAQETVVAGDDGALANVLVRIKPGQLETKAPSRPVTVDQTACMYRPRVSGGVVGQVLELRNSDDTFHNIHGRNREKRDKSGRETVFNRGQPAQGPALKQKLPRVDVLELKCDAHGWMKGFVVVGDNPYFAVTGKDGAFEFQAPVGTYQLEAWHELYGIKTAEVEVKEDGTAEVSFQYQAEKPEDAASSDDSKGTDAQKPE